MKKALLKTDDYRRRWNKMKIGLLNVEPQINNTALMQISTYHKLKGDEVELYSPLFRREYNMIYASSLFDFSDKSQVPKEAIVGGTGFNVESKLPSEISDCDLDYSLFPRCDRSYLWFSRGCIRSCSFCVVPKKEGKIFSVRPKNLNPKGKIIEIMDNNFFGNMAWKYHQEEIIDHKQEIIFASGIDARIITKEQCDFLNKLKIKKIHIAWDDPIFDLSPFLDLMVNEIKPYKLTCYVLIGFNSSQEQDLARVERLREYGIDPFVMPYNKKDQYQKKFSRWVNRKAIWKTVKWEDYKRKK